MPNPTVSDPFLGQARITGLRRGDFSLISDALNDRIPEAEPSHAIENFALPPDFVRVNFTDGVSDSDVAKCWKR